MDLCGFCAFELPSAGDLPDRCPSCGQQLAVKQLQFDKPSPNFYIFLIFLVGLVQLLLLQLILDFLSLAPLLTLIWHGVGIVVFAVLSVLVWRRRFVGYLGAMIMAAVGLTQIGLTALAPELFEIMGRVQGTPLEGAVGGLMALGPTVVFILQLAAYGGILILGIFGVSADFATQTIYRIANVPSDLYRLTGPAAHFKADRLAQHKQWASAVVYWRRAVAADPGRVLYALYLAEGYRRLGFEGRALDILDDYLTRASTAQAKQKIEALRLQTIGQWRQKEGKSSSS